jgi:hypothetical protein
MAAPVLSRKAEACRDAIRGAARLKRAKARYGAQRGSALTLKRQALSNAGLGLGNAAYRSSIAAEYGSAAERLTRKDVSVVGLNVVFTSCRAFAMVLVALYVPQPLTNRACDTLVIRSQLRAEKEETSRFRGQSTVNTTRSKNRPNVNVYNLSSRSFSIWESIHRYPLKRTSASFPKHENHSIPCLPKQSSCRHSSPPVRLLHRQLLQQTSSRGGRTGRRASAKLTLH